MSTSFRNMFRDGLATSIEIPMIQRDYAQGRKDPAVTRIRKAFLQVLRDALAGNEPVGLDFVYGELQGSRLIPFDGQQRLTTLFLLHWYLAVRSSVPDDECAFLAGFTYRTRFSARHFCEKLVSQRPPFPAAGAGCVGRHWLSHWLTDQHWYAGAWKHDPTIQSMLVALDDIHDLFAADDERGCRECWNRLVASEQPRITFDFLSLREVGRPDELYIKMNSRGKPLTRFEHFKADFENTLGTVSIANRNEFARKIDQDWSDLLWPLRDSSTGQSQEDTIIDDEFLRLFHFIGDIVIHRQGLRVDSAQFKGAEIEWARRIYGASNERAMEAQCYMMDVLDSLHAEFRRRDIKDAAGFTRWFEYHFSEKGHQPGRVTVFDKVDLFADCCAKYGNMNGQVRAFPLARTLLLFAFLEHLLLMHQPARTAPGGGQRGGDPGPERPGPDEVARRLRTVRNLIFASDNEIRPANFAAQLDEIAGYMDSGSLDVIQTFNVRQIDEERKKDDLLRRHPGDAGLKDALHRLEDHKLLRGCLAVFDLAIEPAAFIRRTELFHEAFPEDGNMPAQQVCAALLACGDYSQRTRNARYQFGSPRSSHNDTWRGLLTSANIARTGAAMRTMLDAIDRGGQTPVGERLQAVSDAFLARQERARRFNWQYYLVKYPAMRRGDSGLYVPSAGAMGFGLCMLNKTQLNSYYRDPYLSAIIERSGAREGEHVEDTWFYGWDCYSPEKRWIKLLHSGYRVLSCREDGFQLQAPEEAAELAVFDAVCRKHGVGADLVLRMPQAVAEDTVYDEKDRIEAAANLLGDLIAGHAARTSGQPG